MDNFRVRFALPKTALTGASTRRTISKDSEVQSRQNSRFACQACKRMHLKCDESYPVCQRCARRGTVCRPAPRECRWQIELPNLTISNTVLSRPNTAPQDDQVLQHWFHHTCHILVVDGSDDNPFSYSIAPFLHTSESLLQILKSISFGHQYYFKDESIIYSLELRHRAIQACRRELGHLRHPMHLYFLTAYMLGVSATYIDHSLSDFGMEHLLGARAMIDTILADRDLRVNPLTRIVFGSYIYWDMTCSFLVPPSKQRPINDPLIYEYVQEVSRFSNPVTGRSTEIFYILCVLGRYIRATLEGEPQDLALEATIEHELLAWEPDAGDLWWHKTGEAFRKQGLISLHRISGQSRLDVTPGSSGLFTSLGNNSNDTTNIRHSYALTIIELLLKIPPSTPIISLQSLPLLTAGAELTEEDTVVKQQVQARFQAMYSLNRIPTNLFVLRLLTEIWNKKRDGVNVMWQKLMLDLNWNLRF